MTARDPEEANRSATPLELLFDLTFVVATAQIVIELAHGIADGQAVESTGPFLMVFFAIWWAWMNFTWFASAYDSDDVAYRLLTMVQMAGVLLLAAGVPRAFSENDYTTMTIGYAVMRAGLIALWIRAGIEHPGSRGTTFRFAAGVGIIQIGWMLRLLLPEGMAVPSFIVLVALELSVPIWAERTGRTSWHPHHIAERYGLFVIIILGESVLAATTGLQSALDEGGLSGPLITVAIASLGLLFSLWWLYFLEPAGDGLAANRGLAFLWGYGHYGIFGALAALGAGLEVAVEATGHLLEATPLALGYAVAFPVATFLILLWAMHAPMVHQNGIRPSLILPAAVLILAIPPTAGALGPVAVVVLVAAVCIGVIVGTLVQQARAR